MRDSYYNLNIMLDKLNRSKSIGRDSISAMSLGAYSSYGKRKTPTENMMLANEFQSLYHDNNQFNKSKYGLEIIPNDWERIKESIDYNSKKRIMKENYEQIHRQ